MANMCYFEMCVVGKHENIKKFYEALSQSKDVWMGRGASAEILYDSENKAFINGECKWSIQSALIDNAVSMRKEPERWYKLNTNYEYITLWEACEKYDLKMEVYSEECGLGFQEHYKYVDGDITNECIDWCEYYVDHDEYATKKEFEEEYKISITNDEWESADYVSRGGFESWEFSI